LFVYGGAYAPPPKPLVLPGLGHSPQSAGGDAMKTRLAMDYKADLLYLRNKPKIAPKWLGLQKKRAPEGARR
jgi:hypothetical protein